MICERVSGLPKLATVNAGVDRGVITVVAAHPLSSTLARTMMALNVLLRMYMFLGCRSARRDLLRRATGVGQRAPDRSVMSMAWHQCSVRRRYLGTGNYVATALARWGCDGFRVASLRHRSLDCAAVRWLRPGQHGNVHRCPDFDRACRHCGRDRVYQDLRVHPVPDPRTSRTRSRCAS